MELKHNSLQIDGLQVSLQKCKLFRIWILNGAKMT